MKIFAEQLKALREQEGISQTRLDTQLDLGPKETYLLEHDLKEPNLAELRALASYFKCSVDYLLGISEVCNYHSIVNEVTSLREANEKLNADLLNAVMDHAILKTELDNYRALGRGAGGLYTVKDGIIVKLPTDW